MIFALRRTEEDGQGMLKLVPDMGWGGIKRRIEEEHGFDSNDEYQTIWKGCGRAQFTDIEALGTRLQM